MVHGLREPGMIAIRVLTICALMAPVVRAHADDVDCTQFRIEPTATKPLHEGTPPRTCKARTSNGFAIPDADCTPGAINTSVTLGVLQNPAFRTACLRGQTTSEKQKNGTYDTYGIPHPDHNTGVMQVCELDHLISLELGGADTLDNIWPQCGPNDVALIHRYFKQKDIVENFLAKQVREGVMRLEDVQKGIASDWTQYLDVAKAACKSAKC